MWYEFQSPIYGSRTTGWHRNRANYYKFQSPIYGSRTQIGRGFCVHSLSFNPLSTGHAPQILHALDVADQSFNPLSTGHAPVNLSSGEGNEFVSIPYLRVTHYSRSSLERARPLFQSPIYGSRTPIPSFNIASAFLFQSPIYGSRTIAVKYSVLFPRRFQSPIYGSRTWLFWSLPFFHLSFNPLSTGHAHGIGGVRCETKQVSIPYLRVTHLCTSLLLL